MFLNVKFLSAVSDYASGTDINFALCISFLIFYFFPSCYLEVVWNWFGLTVRVLVQMLCFSVTRLSCRSQQYIPWSFFFFLLGVLAVTLLWSLLCLSAILPIHNFSLLKIIMMMWCEFSHLSDYYPPPNTHTFGQLFVPLAEVTLAWKLWTPGAARMCAKRSFFAHWRISGLGLLFSTVSVRPNSFWLLDNCSTVCRLENLRRCFYSFIAK